MTLNPDLRGRLYRQAETHLIRIEDIERHRNALVAQSFQALPGDFSGVPISLPWQCLQGALTAVLLDGDLGIDTMRLVLHAMDVSFIQKPVPNMETKASARIDDIAVTQAGEKLTLRVHLQQADGTLLLEATVEFLERNPRPKLQGDDDGIHAPTQGGAESLEVLFEHKVPLHRDSVVQMLDALGEHNPLYRDVELAQLANLPAPCVPPSYVIAIAHHALEQALGPSGHRIQRFGGRFARLPWMGDTLHLVVGRNPGPTGWLEIRDGKQRSVFCDASFEMTSETTNSSMQLG